MDRDIETGLRRDQTRKNGFEYPHSSETSQTEITPRNHTRLSLSISKLNAHEFREWIDHLANAVPKRNSF